ncbi:hypothetical protein LCGC14_0294850 [marine sediment metagenome]|uniref:Uncharacterized protein n=1 Tax=marine sediment metagenome TaxID=412755 RepID=A0A0F9U939_9ZZZZ
MTEPLQGHIKAPFDSDDFPKTILVQGTSDIEHSDCGKCGKPAKDWPFERGYHPNSRPGTMYQAELFCTTCFPFSYNGKTGKLVDAYTGEGSIGSFNVRVNLDS